MATRIPNLWGRLNALVPNPDCDTRNEDYELIVWRDARAQPTIPELEAVTQAQIDNQVRDQQADSINELKAIKAVLFAVADRMGVARATLGQEARNIYRGLL